MNSIMTQILKNDKYNFITQNLDLPIELQLLIDSGFRKEQDCILLKEFVYFGPGELDSDYKKTAFEDFLNEINIDGYIPKTTAEFDYLKYGLEFGKVMYQKLNETFQMNFRIIILFEIKNKEKNIDIPDSCIIKFYTIRQSCDDKFRIDNLEQFQNKGIMIIE